MNQRGFQCGLKGEHTNALPLTHWRPLYALDDSDPAAAGQGWSSDTSSCPRRSPRTAAWNCSGRSCTGTIWSHGCARRSRDSAAIRQSPDRPGAAGLVLPRGPAPRAPPLAGRRSAGDALLWLGPVAHPPDGRRLVAAVHAGDAGAAHRLESGSRDPGVGAARAATPDDRRGWVGHPDGGHRRLGLPRLQPPSSEGPELLPAGRARGPDGAYPSPQEPGWHVHDSKQAIPFLRGIIDDLRPDAAGAWPWSSAWTPPSSSAGFSTC